jgi:hypothetical protein
MYGQYAEILNVKAVVVLRIITTVLRRLENRACKWDWRVHSFENTHLLLMTKQQIVTKYR